jgi:two-component system chemotaxis response regulator CheY
MSANTAPASPASPRHRVLIVDGDADTRELYRHVFAQRGWAVIEASDGREALVLALSEQPSIVVMELWLLFIDGVALCRLLRRDSITSNVPILVVTTESRGSYLEAAMRAGANGVLIKPSAPNLLVAQMERLTEATAPPTAFAQPRARPASLVKAHQRFETTTPNEPAPHLVCPTCTTPLIYEKTFFGGVSRRNAERWDYFRCPRCGEFSYRHRTRKLRPLA